LICSTLAGCGKDEPKKDYESLAATISEPTGTLDSGDDAKSVALAFKDQGGSYNPGAAGARREAGFDGSVDSTVQCPAGGTIVVSASGNQKKAQASFEYNQCCYTEGCCANGDGEYFYSAQPATSEFSFCGNWNLDVECHGSSASGSFDGCFGSDGYWYAVEVQGKTFAVSGSFDGKNGSWKVKTAKGTWTCEAQDGAGSCTDGTNTITWT
jgi:hypothetical protein